MDYKKYLKTSHWKELTNKRKGTKAHGECYLCKSKLNLHTHHRRYSWRGASVLFGERNKSLATLCGNCHAIWHSVQKNKVMLWGDIKRIQKNFRVTNNIEDSIRYCSKKDCKRLRLAFLQGR